MINQYQCEGFQLKTGLTFENTKSQTYPLALLKVTLKLLTPDQTPMA